jgi:hypothetical protein
MEIEGAEIDIVLQTCLEEVASGEETLDSVIRKYPQLEADLRHELEAAAWFQSHKENLVTRPDFLRRSSRHLYAQIRKENPNTGSFSSASKPSAAGNAGRPYRPSWPSCWCWPY